MAYLRPLGVTHTIVPGSGWAARTRWEREGNPVVARSVEVVASRADELTDDQWALIEAARPGKVMT